MSEHALTLAPMTADEIARKMAGGHSVFSPSGAEMTMTCLGALIPNALAEDETTFEAAEGTVAHSVGETWLKTGERPDHLVGRTVEMRGHEIEITEEMLGFVQDYIDLCDEVSKDAEHCSAENHVDISDLTPIPDQGGTMDYCAFRWQHLDIVDLKYGKEAVFAFYKDEQKVNKQLAIYAWGIFKAWDWLYNFQTITLHISQPRLPHLRSSHTMTRDELITFANFARGRWALAWDRNAPRTPSIRGCRWCKIRQTCPALYLFMEQDISDVFDDVDVIEGEVISRSWTHEEMDEANDKILDELAISPFPNLPKPPELSTAALAKLLRYRRFMENFFNAVYEELLERANSELEEIPYWKLVESRTRRKIVDDEDFVVEELVDLGLEEKDCFETKLKSPAALERTIHAKLKMSIKKAGAFLEERGLTVRPPGKKTLAETSDNRPALPKDGDVFDDVEPF